MRRKRVYEKHYRPDPVHSRIDVGRLTNYIMADGKKSTAEKIVRQAFEIVAKETKEDPIVVFDRAVQNASPLLEVKSKRVGGANYQVPMEVRPDRRFILALRWMVGAARSAKGKPMAAKIAAEIVSAAKNEGAAIKKKQDMHRMAEANRAFAHFAR